MTETIVGILIKAVLAAAGAVLTTYLVPFLKEKRLYAVVKKAVEAAEKLSQNARFDKKEYVFSVLRSRGVRITPEVDAVVEGCVLELDLLLSGLFSSPEE
ncbi:MAG: hypothetical protein IJR89_03110 [Clostridia bacterium]|nr:hypothetical protein [Clostridia bacterium]